MEDDAKQPSCSDPVLLCCLCKNLLRDPVQLHCLHSCCRQCLSSTTDNDLTNNVTCPSCNIVTQTCDAEPNSFLKCLVRNYAAVADTNVCAICKENGDADVLAQIWCGSCQQSLCEDCVPAHNRYNRNHSTQSLDELKSLEDSLLKHPSPPSCSLHNRPLEIVCFTCEKAECLNCWAACSKAKHETGPVADESFEVGLQNLKASISSMEDEILKKSEVFEQCKSALSELKSARGVHLEKMQQRKRRIVDTVEIVYQEIELATRSMYDSMEMEAENVAAAAASLEASLNFSQNYVRRLVGSNSSCDLWNQQKLLRKHLSSLSSELAKLKISIDESKSICIEPSLPENLEYVLKSWIGEPRLNTARASSQPQSQLFFCAPSGSVQLPSKCYDVALTQDGRVLLAAREKGLLELCTRGHTLSRWRPPMRTNNKKDEVEAVNALSDGRVAVGVFYVQVIVLLRRSTDNSPSSEEWIEDRRLDKLPSPACRLSLHEDTLAVAMWISDNESEGWDHGHELQLMDLSNGKRLAALTREYAIGDVALTAQAIITSSSKMETLGDNREAYIIDAHDRNSDVRLWRHEIKDDEILQNIFPAFSSPILYVSIQMSNGSSGRVASISLDDGSEQRHRVLYFEDRLLPMYLSVDRSGAVVAALCTNSESQETTTLTLNSIAMV